MNKINSLNLSKQKHATQLYFLDQDSCHFYDLTF